MEAAGRPHFGALLRQFRLDAGMTQQELAERAKLSVEAVSTLERGARTRPYRETVILLGRALGLSPEREALLRGAIGTPHPSRQRERSEVLSASLLRLVNSDAQGTPRHNLAQQLTSFVGRQREGGEIAGLLHEHPLVTIVGAGGVGKTRIAVQVGNELLDGCPDGVWLVDLAPLADKTLVASSVLSALQLPSTAGSVLDVVVAYLKTRRLLLILDNCEHVITEARDVATRILESCAFVRILSTSREPLDVAAEHVFRLPSLAVPPDSDLSARDALTYDAVRLFVDRARAVDAGFALSDLNTPDVGEICRRLDGIPLAIELAAARVRALAPHQIVRRLDHLFRLLAGGDPRALPRHQTMTALIDWSYDLLTAREQRFFESLAVFAGGCTLEAATAVCADSDEDEIDVLDLITSLVTKSLLIAELVRSEQRYWLLDTSRRYAREKLMARGDHEQVARRHALLCADLAERIERAWDITPDREWLPRAQLELENWRAALEWALGSRGDVILGQRLAVLFRRSFPLPEGRRWVHAALELVSERTSPYLVAGLEYAEAIGAHASGEPRVSLAAAERALVRYRELGDALGSARVQCLAGASLVDLGRPGEGEPRLRDALEGARALGERRLVAHIIHKIGAARSAVGDFGGARSYLTEALGLMQALGAAMSWTTVASVLANTEFDAGNPETALRLMVDVLETYRALNSPLALPGIAVALSNIAAYLIALDRYDEARMHANEALDLGRGLLYAVLVAESLETLSLAALLQPHVEGRRTSAEHQSAAVLLGFVDTRRTTLGISKVNGLQHQYDRALAVLRNAIGAGQLANLMAAGTTMTEDQAIDQARALK